MLSVFRRVFRPGPGPFAFALAMIGAKLGDRLLVVGAGTPGLAAALAAKVGLTGHACFAARTADQAERLRDAAAREGVLADIAVSQSVPLPYETGAFDVAVVDSTDGSLGLLSPEHRVGLLADLRRVVRMGGRVIVVDRAPRGGLAALLSHSGASEPYVRTGGAAAALKAEGFRPVRILAEREGYRFVEGMNR